MVISDSICICRRCKEETKKSISSWIHLNPVHISVGNELVIMCFVVANELSPRST